MHSTRDLERPSAGRHLRRLSTSTYNHFNKQVLLPPVEPSQFTANPFIQVLLNARVAISMDGVGRAIDNVFIERLWRTIKYDHIYLNPAESGNALRQGLEVFIDYYNEDRPHSSLDDATPDEVYYRSRLQQRAA